VDKEMLEHLQREDEYDRMIWCEQAGHEIIGDSCDCGKRWMDIAGNEQRNWQ